MSNYKIKKYYRVCPTLDAFIDINAESKEEALDKMVKLSEKAVFKCWQELSSLGFMDMGADPPFCTDSWETQEEVQSE